MTMVVAFAPDGRGRGVLHLAAMLARSAGDDLVVCAVVPAPWPPGLARVDAEYQAELERTAQHALGRARARLPSDVAASYEVLHARSAPAGVLEMAERVDASLIVAGPAVEGGGGMVSVGSTTARLLHSSHVPVALAPRGFHVREGARVERVTVAFGGSHEDLVVATASVAARLGASLRVASFAVQARPPYTSGVGHEAEGSIENQWIDEITAAARAALHDESAEIVIGEGEDWGEALEDVPWREGDVLVVGSSSIGPIARVFLGSRATKIVRHSPVPVVVVPRGRAEELASEAASASTAAG
jgi:nucleotide-binding universal stress UspA family protein